MAFKVYLLILNCYSARDSVSKMFVSSLNVFGMCLFFTKFFDHPYSIASPGTTTKRVSLQGARENFSCLGPAFLSPFILGCTMATEIYWNKGLIIEVKYIPNKIKGVLIMKFYFDTLFVKKYGTRLFLPSSCNPKPFK